MSDPLSITGSAVGIISLGLQVCGEIVSYCQDWQSFDEDIQRIYEKADGLRMPLKRLQRIIEYAQRANHADASDLEAKAQSLQQAITRLKSATDRCAFTGSITSNGFRYQLQKAKYPFKKDGLRDISNDLDSVQSILNITLQIYSMERTQAMHETISKHMQNIVKGQPIPFMAPSRLRQLCDQRSMQQAIEPCLNITAQNNPSNGLNSAPLMAPQVYDGPDCIYRSHPRFPSKSKSNSSKEYRYSMSLLGFIFRASFTFNKGAGGVSIAPLLHMQPLLDKETSVGYKIIIRLWDHRKIIENNSDYAQAIDSTIKQFQEAFDQQEASPIDMFGHGRSIFDIAMMWLMPSFTDDPIWFSHSSRLLTFLLDLISIPDIARIIILESEGELQDIIESKRVSPNHSHFGCTLLGLSFGWPQGLQILLRAGADASTEYIRFIQDTPQGETYESIKLMLEAGCGFDFYTIGECQKLEDGSRIRSLLIHHMATRIRKMWDYAQIHLPLSQLPNMITCETATDKSYIFGIHVFETRAKLVAQGTDIDARISTPHLNTFTYESCFSHVGFSAETLEEFYRQGFRGVNEFDQKGFAPLQYTFYNCFWGLSNDWKLRMERMKWFVSKGAALHLTVPETSASIAHHIGVSAVSLLRYAILMPKQSNPMRCFQVWKQGLSRAGKGCFLLPSITDGCICPCSPNGCTTMSVALRHVLRYSNKFALADASLGMIFRELIQFFIDSSQETPVVHEGFIRCFTFDALDLKHACCIEFKGFLAPVKLKSREEEEIEEIIDEQKLRLIDFEKLVIEFQAKFDELALPMMEFLEGHWYNRMIDFLRHRDRYDEEHIIGSKRIGVNLLPEEEFSPNGILLLIGRFHKVVDIEVSPRIE